MKKIFHLRGQIIRDDKGVAAIEFAMVLPVLVLLLTGMVDYGMYIHKKMQLQELSRRAVEYVVQGGQESAVAANIIEASDLYDASSVTYSTETVCECADGDAIACTGSTCADPNDYIRSFFATTVTGTYTPVLPYPGFPDSITMTGYSRLQFAR
jgi:Flp pilus assembly protein TadG